MNYLRKPSQPDAAAPASVQAGGEAEGPGALAASGVQLMFDSDPHTVNKKAGVQFQFPIIDLGANIEPLTNQDICSTNCESFSSTPTSNFGGSLYRTPCPKHKNNSVSNDNLSHSQPHI